jgi:phosphohistidine phosphatase
MKTVYLIRHAKSSWDDTVLSDFERPLNNRGRLDAPRMAALLHQRGAAPQLIICSSARRTTETAMYFAQEFAISPGLVQQEHALYDSTTAAYMDVLCSVPQDISSVILIGHNPTITRLANILSHNSQIDDMPTCAVACLHFEQAETWIDIRPQAGILHSFDYPRMYR